MRFTLTAAAAAALVLSAATGASAAMVPNAITGVTGIPFAAGDSGTFDGDGNIQRVFNGAGLTVVNASDQSTWTHANNWQNGWQGGAVTGTLIADLGSLKTNLASMYVWNVAESGAVNRGTKTMDVYYSTNPSPAPTANTTYNFGTATGWTLLASNVSPTQGTASGTDQVNAVVNLSSIPSARYIGLNLKENYGSTSPARIGFAEIQFTQAVPEPTGAAAIAAAAGAGLFARRRRRA